MFEPRRGNAAPFPLGARRSTAPRKNSAQPRTVRTRSPPTALASYIARSAAGASSAGASLAPTRRQPDAGGDAALDAVEDEPLRGDQRGEVGGHARGLVHRAAAAAARRTRRRRAARARRRAAAGRDRVGGPAQQLVARVVAVGVVDRP